MTVDEIERAALEFAELIFEGMEWADAEYRVSLKHGLNDRDRRIMLKMYDDLTKDE